MIRIHYMIWVMTTVFCITFGILWKAQVAMITIQSEMRGGEMVRLIMIPVKQLTEENI